MQSLIFVEFAPSLLVFSDSLDTFLIL